MLPVYSCQFGVSSGFHQFIKNSDWLKAEPAAINTTIFLHHTSVQIDESSLSLFIIS
jgi:hypothetical protein